MASEAADWQGFEAGSRGEKVPAVDAGAVVAEKGAQRLAGGGFLDRILGPGWYSNVRRLFCRFPGSFWVEAQGLPRAA